MKPTRNVKTLQDIPPRDKPGYYEGFSTLSQKEHWDAATRKIVEKRLAVPSPLKFFSVDEAEIMRAVLDCVLPQSDRDADHQIPLLPIIDGRLHAKRFDGYIYEGTLEDDDAYRRGIACLRIVFLQTYRRPATELTVPELENVLLTLRDEKGGPFWQGGTELPADHFWNLLIQDAVSAYYAHPYAWDEVGFGGPAYPRGYMRTVNGLPEPWESGEARYEWKAPEESRSDVYSENQKLFQIRVGTGRSESH